MSSRQAEDALLQVEERLSYVTRAVLERGYDDTGEDFDDYSANVRQYEFRKLVTFQLYEVYFPPKRHEFELQLLTEVVDAVTQSDHAVFLGTAALSGIVGSTAYSVSKRLFSYVAERFGSDRARSMPGRARNP